MLPVLSAHCAHQLFSERPKSEQDQIEDQQPEGQSLLQPQIPTPPPFAITDGCASAAKHNKLPTSTPFLP